MTIDQTLGHVTFILKFFPYKVLIICRLTS